ncbi:hypothetical protein RJT34_10087 [Clitoria ternatea]|uniref:Uncharacterized protein n=1 Tax=Clitoria ternatea TaxID=43366 RepID=A0AAN9K9L5_CLITE
MRDVDAERLHLSVVGAGGWSWLGLSAVLVDALNAVHSSGNLTVRYEEIMSDSGYLDEVLAQGARNAADIADTTLHNVYQAMGFLKR